MIQSVPFAEFDIGIPMKTEIKMHIPTWYSFENFATPFDICHHGKDKL